MNAFEFVDDDGDDEWSSAVECVPNKRLYARYDTVVTENKQMSLPVADHWKRLE